MVENSNVEPPITLHGIDNAKDDKDVVLSRCCLLNVRSRNTIVNVRNIVKECRDLRIRVKRNR